MTIDLASRKAFAVWFRGLERWDVKFFLGRLKSKWPAKKLGEFVKDHNEKVKPYLSPDKAFRILGVTKTGGVFFAYVAQGKAINQPYKKVDARDIAYNPYRINVGSIGLVPPELAGNYISPAYVVFSTDENRLSVDYLLLVMKSDWFNPTLRATTAGSVRQSLTYDLLCRLEMPLPPLPVQEEVVTFWQAAQESVAKSRETVTKLEADIQKVIYDKLGMKPPRTDWAAPKVFALWWKELERWGIEFNQSTLNSPDPKKGRFSTAELRTLIADLENGWSPKCLDRPANQEEWGVLKLGAVSFGVFNPKENKALPSRLKSDPKLEIHSGDVLISRANITRLVGASTLVSQTRPKLMLCDKIFRVVFKSKSPILPDYLVEIMKTAHLRHQIENAVTGTSPTMKNITKTSLLGLVLPVPPLEVQQEIVDTVNRLRQRIAKERKTAEERQIQASREVEEMILEFRPSRN